MEEMHTLTALTAAIEPLRVINTREGAFEGITADSRRVVAGGIFVAVPGTRVDGHDYIDSAVAAGVGCVVCSRLPEHPAPGVVWIQVADASVALAQLASAWWGYPSRHLTLVGVTGTNGKTTIATLLYELARLGGQRAGLLSTVVNKVNDSEVASTHTTPDPLELNALLARMVSEGCTFAAMEVSSHAASQHRITALDFDGAIFTNLTRDHLDYHGTVANYLRAKQSFFDALKPEAWALTNADDRNGNIMLQNTRAGRHTYSVRGIADYRGRVIENRLDGMLMSFDGTEVETRFAGQFNASNLTAVYGAGMLMGMERTTLLRAISQLEPVAGRFQPFRSTDGVVAIVDYAHTPDALVNVLDTINEIIRRGDAHRGVISVVGCGGDRDRGKRPIMAAEAARRSTRVVLTSDNPRSEDPEAIIEEMKAGLDSEALSRTIAISDRHTAIATAIAEAHPGDVVLVAGKGHETYQIIGEQKTHFDDREEVAAALRQRTI